MHQYADAAGDVTASASALRDLINGRLAELGISLNEAARRGKVDKAVLHRLADPGAQRARIPDIDVLDRVADGLDLPRMRLRLAAAESYGYVISRDDADDETAQIVAAVHDLPPARRRDLLGIANTFLTQRRSRRQGEDQDR